MLLRNVGIHLKSKRRYYLEEYQYVHLRENLKSYQIFKRLILNQNTAEDVRDMTAGIKMVNFMSKRLNETRMEKALYIKNILNSYSELRIINLLKPKLV